MTGSEGKLQTSIGIALVVLPWLISGSSAIGTPVEQRLAGLVTCAGLLALGCSVKACQLGWCIAAALSSLAALAQYFGWSGLFDPWVSTTAIGEAFANLRQRNQFATLTGIGLLASLARVTSVKRPVSVVTTTLYLLLLALGNAASGSRTGLLQWVLVLVAVAVWPSESRKQKLQYASLAMGAYVTGCVALPWLLEVTTGVQQTGVFGRLQENPQSCQSRIVLWSDVLQLITAKPFLGWGWGELSWAHFVTLYPGARFCDILTNAHNLILHIAVELGLPLAVVISLGMTYWVLRYRPWRETHPQRQMAWGILLIIGVHSLFEYPLWYAPFQICTLLSLSILWMKPSELPSEPLMERKRIAAIVGANSLGHRAVAGVALTAVAVYSGWDYWRVSQIFQPLSQRAPAFRDNTMEKIRPSWLFRDQVSFAELSTTEVSPHNAEQVLALASHMLHFSPEPMVVEKLLESALLLQRRDEIDYYLERFKRAFPKEHRQWVDRNAKLLTWH